MIENNRILLRGILAGFFFLALLTVFVVVQAVPGIVGAGLRASDAAAISRLRTILWAEDYFLKSTAVDRDVDGKGEYGFFRELAGETVGQSRAVQILLEPEFRELKRAGDIEVAVLSGYCFVVYLPGSYQVGVADSPSRASSDVAVDGAEVAFVAYAWPYQLPHSGTKVFFLNENDEIWESDNNATGQHYGGFNRVPVANAALAGMSLLESPREDGRSRDGGIWRRWKGKKGRREK